MAIERRDYKRALEEDMNPQARILRALWDHINLNKGDGENGDLYQSADLCKCVKDEMAWDYCKGEFLSRFIYEQAHIGRNRKREHFKRRVGDATRWFFRMNRELMLERGKTMFGIDLEEKPEDAGKRDPFKDE